MCEPTLRAAVSFHVSTLRIALWVLVQTVLFVKDTIFIFWIPDRFDVDELDTLRREHVWEYDLSWSSHHRDLNGIRALQETFLFARRLVLNSQKAAMCWYIASHQVGNVNKS